MPGTYYMPPSTTGLGSSVASGTILGIPTIYVLIAVALVWAAKSGKI